ncbi:hypothetical protein AWB79_01275 [Caballeronia hypogeia]|uniref:Uncharacterized protein n=1 Tax=Caballeronia hypogeia TaxID=1777140 RepID=A0A157ZTQ3_9BURK|nr:hypothetical protein [Caballeronia hypogeia]SAK48297.1 hypothetical protein AWB79_01275 [Caballeronia hypogeia]
MSNTENAKRAAVRALNRVRGIRATVEERDRLYRAAPSDAPGDVLERLRANAKVRAAVLKELNR